MPPIGLYLHIPFCNGKCPYCDFYSVSADSAAMDDYTDFLCQKILQYGKQLSRPADTLYFGGGTPSLLGARRILKLVEAARTAFGLQNAEITMEANPAKAQELDAAMLSMLRQGGVNRLSIGLQSANDRELRLLGRKHSVKDALAAVRLAQLAGFDNISLDLMLAIQEQTKESLSRSIQFCRQANIQHVSAYLLKIEEGTPYFMQRQKMQLPDEDMQGDLYLFACEELEKAGFAQYEISNFSLPGKESRHNLKYWNDEEYLGIGPAAHSFIGGRRFYYPRSLNAFMDGAPCLPEAEEEKLIQDGGQEEFAMLRLRLNKGLTEQDFSSRFCMPIPQAYRNHAERFTKYGLVVCDEKGIRFTPKGFLVSNELIAQIIL